MSEQEQQSIKVGRPKKDSSLSNAERQKRYRDKKRGGRLAAAHSPGRPIQAKLISEIKFLYYVLHQTKFGYRVVYNVPPFLTFGEAQREADRFSDNETKCVPAKTVFFLSPSPAFFRTVEDFEKGIKILHE